VNEKQFNIWKRQKTNNLWRDLTDLQRDFANRGLTNSGIQNEAEDNLKKKYANDIEIMRLGIKRKNASEHVAVKMTKSSRNNIFINSHINGQLELGGQGNSFIKTEIGEIKKQHPFWFWFTTIGTLVGIVTGLMFLAQYLGLLSASLRGNLPTTPISETIATTTPNLSDLFSKALSYETVAERQDFLGKYIGKQVYGHGVIEEVSRAGEMFLIDINLGKLSVVCPQEKTDVLEGQYPFLKGKRVMLYGIFTYNTIFGHGDNISIDPCSFEI
jgi:hypothetical protein